VFFDAAEGHPLDCEADEITHEKGTLIIKFHGHRNHGPRHPRTARPNRRRLLIGKVLKGVASAILGLTVPPSLLARTDEVIE
jgi:hypothetical protein